MSDLYYCLYVCLADMKTNHYIEYLTIIIDDRILYLYIWKGTVGWAHSTGCVVLPVRFLDQTPDVLNENLSNLDYTTISGYSNVACSFMPNRVSDGTKQVLITCLIRKKKKTNAATP